MNSKITLEQRKRSCYRNTECALHDAVYLIKNEYQELIGHMFLDETEDGWRIEWLELLSIFQQHGYLRSILQELQSQYSNKKITLECSENLLKKYQAVGCRIVEEDTFREMWLMEYAPEVQV